MPNTRRVRVRADDVAGSDLRAGIAAIAREQKVPEAFPPEVEEAARAAAAAPRLPDLDRTDLPLLTLDPAGSTDLDQALHLARDGDEIVLSYAIADVAAFVSPGDPVDLEAHRRGETMYAADTRVPLHPPVLSEGAASLLPDQVRPALLWTIRLGPDGERLDAQVERARVRSTAQLSYEQAQEMVDSGTGPESLAILAELGPLRLAREAARGGISLALPEQEVRADDGRYRLEFRKQAPIELWNAQLSLLTGFAAASLMVYARVGLLRTVPEPDPVELQRLHRTARALGVTWPAEQLPADFLRGLDPDVPAHAALIVASTRLLRGSGYVAFDGELPAQPRHSGLAAEYAHVTAPLRRLADRYAAEVCVALCAGDDVPAWVAEALPRLPGEMQGSAARARGFEKAVLDLVEAMVLAGREGETFDAVVLEGSAAKDGSGWRGVAMLNEPAVEAPVEGEGEAPVGERVRVRLVEAVPAERRVRFAVDAVEAD